MELVHYAWIPFSSAMKWTEIALGCKRTAVWNTKSCQIRLIRGKLTISDLRNSSSIHHFSGTFSLQLRPTASNGVILFATNDKHTDHIGLFLLNGRVVLSFDTGAGQVANTFLDALVIMYQTYKFL